MDGGGFGKELVRIPIRHEAVSGSQVLFTGGIAVRSETAGMGGYLLVTEEGLYLPGVIKDVDFLAYVFAGDAVVMVLNPYVPVLHDSGGVTLFEFKTDRVKGAHAVTLDFLILFTAAVSASGQGSVVMQFQSHPDSRIQGLQVMELASFEFRVNTAVDQLDRSFHKGLVPGLVSPGGNDGASVMFGKGGKSSFSSASYRLLFFTAAFRLSGTMASGVPP